MQHPPSRSPGPPPPSAVRTHGDSRLASVLGEALSLSGRVERATHHFHTYPAGMHPDSAAQIIAAVDCPDDAAGVHDPFCGGGTVLVEALLADRPASGCDLSPVALMVSRARTAAPQRASALRSHARRMAAAAQKPGPVWIPELADDWYEPHVADELGRLRAQIDEVEDSALQGLLLVVLSSILVKASFRESDTSNRRRSYHRPPGTTAVLFHKKARELGRMLEQMPTDGTVRIRRGDARQHAPPAGTGLVLTSPPYPGVYDYLPMQQLRYAWLDIHPGDGLASEVGSRREFRARGRRDALAQWRKDTQAWIATQARGLPRGGHMGIVVGDGLVGGRGVDTLAPTLDAIQAAGLTLTARASADRPDHARDRVRTEHLVLAHKSTD